MSWRSNRQKLSELFELEERAADQRTARHAGGEGGMGSWRDGMHRILQAQQAAHGRAGREPEHEPEEYQRVLSLLALE